MSSEIKKPEDNESDPIRTISQSQTSTYHLYIENTAAIGGHPLGLINLNRLPPPKSRPVSKGPELIQGVTGDLVLQTMKHRTEQLRPSERTP